ncbi:MAG: hypothetical protein WCS88_04160 [Patescibacteria group bacterium]
MSVLVFARGIKHNKVNFYFSLLTFFNFLWAISLFIFSIHYSYNVDLFFASFINVGAIFLVWALFYFSIYFPYQIFKLSKVIFISTNFLVVIFSIFLIVYYKIFITELLPNDIIHYSFIPYLLLTIIIIFFMLASIIILSIKYNRAEGIFKNQIALILITVIIGGVVGGFFDLFLMYFDNFKYYHLGPLAALLINLVAFYLIFLKGKQLS